MQYQARHTAWIALSGARAGRLRLLATRRYIAPASTSAMVYAVSLLVGRVRWRYESPTTSEISHNSHGTKSVLVTGATRGIGRAIADELGRDHHIIVGGRHQEAVDNVVSELPNASPFVVDLTDEEATATAVSQLDHLDALINSAGVSAT